MKDTFSKHPDNSKNDSWAGYRIKTIEVRNFGGYHGRTTRFSLNCDGVVFSGPNGAGKSTALDAFRLIIRDRPAFNSASAETSSGRTVESYYTGQYASTGSGSRGKKRTAKSLRDIGDDTMPMTVLCVFATEAGECFTAGRMLFIRANGNRDWRNFTAMGELEIDRDFPEWMTGSKMARKLTDLGGTLHATLDDYFSSMAEAFGFSDTRLAVEAFKAFDSAIGVKDMTSVSDFARSYLLPTDDFESVIDTAIEQIEASYEALREIEAARDQVEALEALEKKADDFLSMRKNIQRAQDRLHLVEIARGISLLQVQRSSLPKMKARLEKAQAELDETTKKLAEAEQELESVKASLNSNEFRRAKELRGEKAATQAALSSRVKMRDQLLDGAAVLGMNINAQDEAGWMAGGQRVVEIGEAAADDAEVLRNEQAENNAALKAKKVELDEVKEEIAALDRSKANLSRNLLAAREDIAQSLGASQQDLPFLAELVQIRQGEEAWEGVANRVLGGLGREILVDQEDYSRAVEILNAGKWRGRVVLRKAHLSDHDISRAKSQLAHDSLASKLEVKEHYLGHVVEAMVAQAASHRCVSDQEIGAINGKAVTVRGTVKNGNRAEKNDAHDVNDRTQFILGWDTRSRRAALVAQRDEITREESRLAQISSEYDAGIKKHMDVARLANQIIGMNGWPGFDQVETDTLETRIHQIERELDQLNSPEADALHNRKAELDALVKELKSRHSDENRALGGAENSVLSLENRIEEVRDGIKAKMDEGNPSNGRAPQLRADDRALFRRMLAEESVGLTSEDQAKAFSVFAEKDGGSHGAIWDRIARRLSQTCTGAISHLNKAANGVNDLAGSYLSTWPEEGAKLQRTIVQNDELNEDIFAEWMKALEIKRDDNLPGFEARAAEERDQNVHKHILAIQSAIEDYDDHVKSMMRSINELLLSIPYDPVSDTRAALQVEDSQEEAISLFRSKFDIIRRTAHTEESSDLMEALRELLSGLHDNGEIDNRDRRRKVLSLANWKEVSVRENAITETGELNELRTLTGRDGGSGGQRERLAMLMLGAAQSYGMGGADPSRTATGLQTIVLDEAFLRSSAETAHASTDILSAMGLQVIAATPAEKLGAFRDQASQIITITSMEHQIMAQPVSYEEMFSEMELSAPMIEAEDVAA